jgi:hypothetical protein
MLKSLLFTWKDGVLPLKADLSAKKSSFWIKRYIFTWKGTFSAFILSIFVRFPKAGRFQSSYSLNKWKKIILKRSLCHWPQFLNLFIAPLPTADVLNKRPQTELCALLAMRILIASSSTGWRGIFKGFLQDRGRADCSKNLLVSLFNKGLSTEPTFSRIHLAEQYL